MLGNCPMMVFSFAPKHQGIMELMEMSDYSLSLDRANPQTTLEMLDSLLSNREILQTKMKKRLYELQQDALNPAKLIKNLWDFPVSGES
jgi:hypothetical protein